MKPSKLDAVLARLRSTVRTRGLDKLRECIRIPSISNEAGHEEGIQQMATWVEDWLKRIGFQTSRVVIEGHNPILCAVGKGKGEDRKTAGFYGHYDVQPAGDGWTLTGAFEPIITTVIDEQDQVIVGRGSGDMKGPLCAFLMALEAIWDEHGEYPCDFRIAIEGEEENGSGGFEEWLKQTEGKEFFRDAVSILVPDVHVARDIAPGTVAIPAVGSGLRGLLYFRIEVSGPADAVHSGNSGNVQCPAEALIRIIGSFRHRDSLEFAIPGFNEAVIPLTAGERSILSKNPVTDSFLLKLSGAPALMPLPLGRSRHEQQGAYPSLTVHGISGGNTDPESTPTSIYPKAWAKLSFRLAYGQDPRRMFDLIKTHVERFTEEVLGGTVKVQLIGSKFGGASRVDPTSAPVALATQAMSESWGTEALVELDGGSIPLVALIQQETGKTIVIWGGTDKRSRFHGPDEFLSVDNFAKSSEGMARWIYTVPQAA